MLISTWLPKRYLPILALLWLASALGAFGHGYHDHDHKYGQFTQPDGTVLELVFHGSELYTRTETTDGYTVIFDPATKTYFYATLTPQGDGFASTGKVAGRANPAALGLGKSLKLTKEARLQKIQQKREQVDAVLKERERWESLKEANKKYRALKKEVKKQEKAGKKGFVIPFGTVFPDSDIPVVAQMSEGGESSSNDGPSQAPPSFTLTEDVLGLTILVDFSDDPGTAVTQAQVDDWANQPGYTGFSNGGSVYDYFFLQSNGRLRYSNNVTYYVRVPQPRTYYDDTAVDSGICGRLLLNDALDVLIADGYDFSELTTKTGGRIRACNVFFAGSNSGVWAKGLWPHRWVLSPQKEVEPGKYVYDYQITNIGTSTDLRIGTFLHENGHMLLGYPDFYSYDGNAARIGNFSLMASGNHAGSGRHPTSLDSYMKEASGWMDMIDLDNTSHQRATVQVDNNLVYRYLNPSDSGEYFMWEVRDNTGWEGPIGGATGSVNPATGLLTWHILETGSNTYSSIFTADNPTADYSTPYELLVLETNPSAAVTPWYDDPTPGSNDALRASDVDNMSDSTTPAMKFWDANGRNVASGAHIHSVSADGPSMTFVLGTGAPNGSPSIVLSRANIYTSTDFGDSPPSQSFNLCNGQAGTLNYTISDDVTWLSCDVSAGDATTENDTVNVTFSTTGLAAGDYTGTITVDGGAAGTSVITVYLTVFAQPTLATDPASLTVSAIEGTSDTKRSFNLSNIGGGSCTYSITKTASWLNLSHTSGSLVMEDDQVECTFNVTSLTPGVYNDTIVITSSEATNSPINVPVTLTVVSSDMVVTSPNGGESFSGLSTETITWVSTLGGTVDIDLHKGGSYVSDIVDGETNDGSYDWFVPIGLEGSDYTIVITVVGQPTKFDMSDADFAISSCMSFENGFDGWLQDDTDGTDWTRLSGSTGSSSTGPSSASDGTYYLYIEASSPNYPDVTAAIYKDFDFTNVNQPELTFDYHMYGSAMGTLYLEVSTDEGSTWDSPAAWALSGDQGNAWVTDEFVDLSAYSYQTVRIRFRGVTGTNFTSDMAIDNVCLSFNPVASNLTVTYYGNGNDGGAVPVDANNPYTANDSVTVLGNTGSLSLTGYSFDDWNTADNGTGNPYAQSDIFTITADTDLYAQWSANSYNVNLDQQSGTGGSGSVLATFDSPMPSATAPTRSGFIFGGYYSGTNGTGNAYYSNTMTSLRNWDIANTATLYAQWTAVYTVDFQTDGTIGATLTGDTSQVIPESADCDPVTANTPSGHDFVNWTKDGLPYSTDNPLTVTNVTENLTLVANFELIPAIAITDDGLIQEESEDGEVITVTCGGGTFTDPLTLVNWSLSGQPTGISIDSVTRINGTTAEITLAGNRTVDYDIDITNMSVTCTAAEMSSATSPLSANTGVTFTANNDAESISIADDGLIEEEAEDGEVINVVLSGGTFTDPLTLVNWSLAGQPTGISIDSITRINDSTAEITLTGNRTADYDIDIINMSVTCTAAEVSDTASPLSANTGVIFTANDDAEYIEIADDGWIQEGSENGEVITIILSGGTFSNPLNTSNWSVANLPAGVSKGTLTRVSDHLATIALSGNRSGSYSGSDITNVSVTCTTAEYDDSTGESSLSDSTGVTLRALSGDITLEFQDGLNAYTGTTDTYIYEASTGTNYGTEPTILINNRVGGGPNETIVRGLLRFDLTSLPAGTSITSAQLDFVQDNNVSALVNIVEATGSWSEGSATWSNSNGLYGGTSYGSANTGTTAGASVPSIALNATAIAQIEDWINNPSNNNGFGILTTLASNGIGSSIALRSSENSTQLSRPKLTISYAVTGNSEPEMTVQGQGLTINDNDTTPTTVDDTDFGNVDTAGPSVAHTFTIYNDGDADLLLNGTTTVEITGAASSDFAVTTAPATTIIPNGSTTFEVTFTPSAVGTRTATISIANDDADENPYSFSIEGTGIVSGPTTYTLVYHGNGNDGGSIPVDALSPYLSGTTVTVLAPGTLSLTDNNFDGWNTQLGGGGTSYATDDTFSINANTTLYAQWTPKPAITITANSNSKVYDGTPLVDSGYSLSAGTLEAGHSIISVSVTGTQTNAGISNNVPSNVLIEDGGSNDVTSYYDITYANGVLDVAKATPTATLQITNSPVTYDGNPQSATVSIASSSVPGAVQSVNNGTHTNAGTYAVTADFVPTDSTNYETLSGLAAGDFVIDQATPIVSVWPTASGITYGQALSNSTLSGGSASVAGAFNFDAPAITPDAGTYSAAVTFTPTDTSNYQSVAGNVDVNIAKATPTATLQITNSPVTYDGNPQSATVTIDVSSVPGAVQNITNDTHTDAGSYAVTADFVPTDTANYETLTTLAAGDFVIDQATPSVSVWPTATGITYGQALSNSTLSGGTASVAGSFSFDAPATNPDAGTYSAAVTFTPTDTTNYQSVAGNVDVAVAQATPIVSVWPTATGITYGQALSDSALSGGTASVSGAFSFDAPATNPDAGTYSAAVTFTPTDSANYENVAGSVDVAVAKATPTATLQITNSPVTYDGNPQSATVTIASSSIPGAVQNVTNGTHTDTGTYSVTADFVPTDTANYETLTALAAGDFVIDQATPVVTVWPTATGITYGQALSDSALSGGTAVVAGSFSFDAPAITPDAGTYSAAVTFTPTDTANYQSVAGSVDVNVAKATPTVTVWPTASGITYGQALSDSALSGGTASVAGAFSFDAPATIPDAGTFSTAVTFIPTDTANYENVAGSVDVTVAKATPTATLQVDNSPVTYDGNPQSATVSITTSSVPGAVASIVNGTHTDVGTYAVTADFVPTDTANFETLTGLSAGDFVIEQAAPVVTVWPTASSITYGQALSDSALSGGTASVAGAFSFDAPATIPDAGTFSAAVTFIPTDTTNYENVAGNVDVVVAKATPTATLQITNSPVTYDGNPQSATVTVASSSVPGAVQNVANGTHTDAGTYAVTADFVPTDTANYETLTALAAGDFVIDPATPTVSVWPTATGITYGQALSDSSLSGGTASVAGSFSFDAPATTPDAGTYSAAVTFTPTDTANYQSVAGNVDVAVAKATPTATLQITNSPVTYDGNPQSATVTIASSSIPGAVQNVTNGTHPDAGTYSVTADFVPTDTANYETLTALAAGDFVIDQATPVVSVWPNATGITYGQALSDSALSGGTASVAGSFSFDTPATTPDAGTYSAAVTFTPTDGTNYQSVAGNVDVAVAKAIPTATLQITNSPVVYDGNPQSATVTVASSSVPGDVQNITNGTHTDVGTYAVTADFVPTDTTNYETLTALAAGDFVIEQATPVVTVWPTASSITYGQALSDSSLSGETASVAGSFSFDAPATTPDAGTYSAAVTFTPTDTANYQSVAGSVDVTVAKATPTATLQITNSPVAYDGNPQSATVTVASSSIPGDVQNVTNGTHTDAGTYAVTADFVPTDTANYETLTALAAGDFVIELSTHTVTYDGNSHDSGTAPTDINSPYDYNTLVTVLGAGDLTKTGYNFSGWNTENDGSGDSYLAGASFSIIADTTLYSQWTENTAGFTLSKTTASVDEDGGTDSFSVVLDSQPASSVVILIESSDTDEATVSSNSLTFTTSDWDTPQFVTITGVNDDVMGDDAATVTASVDDASSHDSYDSLADQNVTVTCINDDGFDHWISTYSLGGEAGFNDDPDKDGIANGVESYFGTDPSLSSPNLEILSVTSGGATITLSHPLNANLPPDITATYRWSKDLVSFHNDGQSDGDGTTVSFVQGTPVVGTVDVTANVSGVPTDRIFIIIEVNQTTP